jgi:hypothetical protein
MRVQNKYITPFLLVLLTAALLASCQVNPRIYTMMDDEAQLESYKTFGFHPNTFPRSGQYDSLSSRYIKKAIENEMQRKGFEMADNPDLLVNFNVYVKDKIEISRTPSASLYYHFRHGYGVWGGYPMNSDRITQYTEGTLNIDIVDRKANRLLWEGVAIGRLKTSTYDNMETKVNEAVRLIFEQLA